MTPQAPLAITQLAETYSKLSGLDIRIRRGVCDREADWFAFLQAGFTNEDLTTVIRYIRREIHKGELKLNSLRFSNLIVQLDRFEEWLALAKAANRNAQKPPTALQKMLACREPKAVEQPAKGEARPISDYITALRKAAE